MWLGYLSLPQVLVPFACSSPTEAPFIATPGLHATFDFRVLRQNRRVVSDDSRREELEVFHGVLFDIAHGVCSDRVRKFIVDAYVRGASTPTADDSQLEGSTAVFTKRRYRDRWNRTIVKRAGQACAHNVKIKARVRAKGQRGAGWYGERRVQFLRRKCRCQALWLLQLAGDFHDAYETEPLANPAQKHMMRAMCLQWVMPGLDLAAFPCFTGPVRSRPLWLTSNLAVDQRFANGTQGRVMYWHPKKTENQRLALPASHPDIMARFLKETSVNKQELFPDVDHIDVQVRPETLRSRDEPVILQLPLVPCYALTIHKTQSLSVKHIVRGCLEGVFAPMPLLHPKRRAH